MSKLSLKKGLYFQIREVIHRARNQAYRSVNSIMIEAYWNIGRLIVEEEQRGNREASYGEYILKSLTYKLTQEFGSGYSLTNLKYFRQFYLAFSIGHALRDQLSWTHYRLLLRVEKEEAREWYMNEAADQNWSTRQLERQINSFYYERLLSTKKKALLKEEPPKLESSAQPEDFIKDPFVLEFLDVKRDAALYEKDLENLLVGKLQNFLLEMGRGFSFIERQYRISAGTDHFYVDLTFYNYILKCFVLIDLKIDKLTHQDIGQMDFYVRYFEDKVRGQDDNPTIGIILCSEKNETIVKYSMLKEGKRIFASKYKLHLPTEQELKNELERERTLIEQEQRLLKEAR